MADRDPMDPQNILLQLLDQMRAITERMNSQQVILDRLQSVQLPAANAAVEPADEDPEDEEQNDDESGLQLSDAEAQQKI